jgi:hypothetical protein
MRDIYVFFSCVKSTKNYAIKGFMQTIVGNHMTKTLIYYVMIWLDFSILINYISIASHSYSRSMLSRQFYDYATRFYKKNVTI